MNTFQTPTAIGRYSDGGDAFLDVGRLVGSHLCIQANSGGGKSGAIRRLLEITHGQLQHIVLDVEDEFHTLREKHEYIIAGGDNGDCAATVKNAGALALMILETGFSAIVQLNNLHLEERRQFIAAFLGALIGAPKALWHPALVVLDEAQMYAPQVGVVSSSDAIVSLMMLGRKRGFTGVLAVPRLAGISKDAIGAVNNWLLGRIGQPVDRKASADALGFGSNSAEARGLIELETGQFWGYGPALCRAPALIQIGKAETTYIKAGMAPVPVPPAPAAMQRMLEKLNEAAKAAEVPAEAEVEAEAVDYKTDPDYQPTSAATYERLMAYKAAGFKRGYSEGYKYGRASGYSTAISHVRTEIDRMPQQEPGEFDDDELQPPAGLCEQSQPDDADRAADAQMLQTMAQLRGPEPKPSKLEKPRAAPAASSETAPATGGDGSLSKALQRALNAIGWWKKIGHAEIERERAAVVCGLSPTASTFGVYVSKLVAMGLVSTPRPGFVALTKEGSQRAVVPKFADANGLYQVALTLLGNQPRKVFEMVYAAYPKALGRIDIAKRMGLSPTASTTGVYISKVSAYGLFDLSTPGQVRAAAWLFP